MDDRLTAALDAALQTRDARLPPTTAPPPEAFASIARALLAPVEKVGG